MSLGRQISFKNEIRLKWFMNFQHTSLYKKIISIVKHIIEHEG